MRVAGYAQIGVKTVSALLGDLMLSSDGTVKRKLGALLAKAKELGLE